MIAMQEDFLTPEDVAKKLRVSVDTIQRMLNSGRMTGYKVGGQWRVTARDVDEYLDKQRNTSRRKPDKK